MKKKFVVAVTWAMLLFGMKAVAQFTIAGGAQFTVTGNLLMTLSNTDLINNGNLSAGMGTFSFTGTASSKIGGNQPIPFFTLNIDKDAGDSLLLQRPISVSSQISFQSGFLDLNGFDADLGNTGLLSGEQESSRVVGANGGNIIFTGTLNAPTAANPGNLGMLISSSQNLGNTTIKRGHQSQTNSSGAGNSILRYYDILPANNTGLNATLRFQYFDGELNGLDENGLSFWGRTGTDRWSDLGFDSESSSSNYVEKSGISTFNRFTLSTSGNPLPVVFSWFRAMCSGNTVQLIWQTAQEENSNYFAVERTDDGLTWTSLSHIAAAGNTANARDYAFTDQAPVNNGRYRITEYDLDGRTQHTETIAPNCSIVDGFRVWPNPAQAILYLNINAGTSSAVVIKLFDARGATVLQQSAVLNRGNNLLPLRVKDLASGAYFLSVLHADGQVQSREIIKE